MKWFVPALALSLAAVGPAFAGDMDSMQWIAQCVKDNSAATVSADVVSKYCACMNNRMDNNDTKTITQWENENPNARQACERESGWK
jgi:hypothetical protein